MSHPVVLLPQAEKVLPRERYLTAEIPSTPSGAPSIQCPALDYHLWSTWQEVGDTMRNAPQVLLRQSWRTTPDDRLKPATVAVARDQDDLVIYAELSDADIFNPAQAHGIHAYKLGDVFEIFLRVAGAKSYFEHHVTPGNYALQLQFPSTETFRLACKNDAPDWADPFVSEIPVPSCVLVQPDLELWRALVIIPLGDIDAQVDDPLPCDWRFSFCRYDYTRGQDRPVLSSTSAHPDSPDFHDLKAWGHLSLC